MLAITVVLAGPFFGLTTLGLDLYHHAGEEIEIGMAALANHLVGDQYGIGIPARQIVLGLAVDVSLLDQDWKHCSEQIVGILNAESRYLTMGAVDAEGHLRCYRADQPAPAAVVSDREWFRSALAGRGEGITEFILSRVTGKPMLLFSRAAVRDGEVRAVAYVGLDLNWLSETLRHAVFAETMALHLLRDDGVIIAASSPSIGGLGTKLDAPDLLAALSEGGVTITTHIGDAERLWVVRRVKAVPGDRFHIAVSIDRRHLVATILDQMRPTILLILGLAVVAYVLAWFGSDAVVLGPIRELSKAMARFRHGERTARAGPFYARHEIGRLAATFDDMADAVIDSDRAAASRMREMEALFNASPAAIIALDRTAKVRWWNPAAERIFGFTAEDALGQPHPVVPPEETAHFQQHFEAAMTGQSLRNIRGVRRAKGGHAVEVEFSSAPLRDEAGGVIGVVYVVSDVGERNRLERQFLQAQKMEAVGQLTGGIAHDFNNLLGVLIGNLDLIRERVESDRATVELTDAALGAALRGADLNKRLLAFSRRQALQPERVDIAATLTGMLKLLRGSLGERVDIHLRVETGIWPVRVDPIQLETAIVNLAVNARDAMPEGGTLTIEAENVYLDAAYAARHIELTAGDYVMIAISDIGTGMPPEVAAKAFDPFFTTKEVGKGTGLGLSMVFGFVKQSAGHVNLYSESGHGTTVRLYLPRDSGGGATAPVETSADANKLHGRGEAILVVEDNREVRTVVVRQLRDLGYRVIEAETGDAALAMIANGITVDLVFSDVVMPGRLDGFALAESLRSLTRRTAVLLTSGFTELGSAGQRPHDGAAPMPPLLSKPYRKDELARAVRAALDGRPLR